MSRESMPTGDLPDPRGSSLPLAVQLPRELKAWKRWARYLIQQGVPPDEVRWSEWSATSAGLFDRGGAPDPPPPAPPLSVSRGFAALAETVSWHRGPEKWDVLYRLVYRLHHGERKLLEVANDEQVITAERMARAVRRDAHKMHAFVRFCVVDDAQAIDGRRYVAFHRSSHPIIEREASWFAKRFPQMTWAILTPDGSAAWDGKSISFGPAAAAEDAPHEDDVQGLWLTYYRSIYNPSRVNPRAMLKEMPKKYWSTMPEAKLIPALIEQARDRIHPGPEAVPRRQQQVAEVSRGLSLPQLAEAARNCRACSLCDIGTRVVFGVGPADARLMLVGEQPGDQEDQLGQPFVGPAGQLLDDALREVGISREKIYLTNAVKHFSHEVRGKRRIHRKPKVSEQRACKPWLEAELAAVQPKVLVCLGATAAQNIVGRTFRMTRHLGGVTATPWCQQTIATYHPAAILRAASGRPQDAAAQRQQLMDDLRLAASICGD